MEHKHVLGAGWDRGGQTWRECVYCRKAYLVSGRGLVETKSDYTYYKEMADQVEQRTQRH
jgi:hypothetical protein